MSNKALHVGVYGFIENNSHILLVRKTRGPYKDLFDLPGGRPLHGEPLIEALQREIQEETGLKCNNFSLMNNLAFLIPYVDSNNHQKELYHIALIYRVNDFNLNDFNATIKAEDVNGSIWMDPQLISHNNSSPLVLGVHKC